MVRRAASTSGFPDEPGTAAAPSVLQFIETSDGWWETLRPGESLPVGASRVSLQVESVDGESWLMGDDATARGVRPLVVGAAGFALLVR